VGPDCGPCIKVSSVKIKACSAALNGSSKRGDSSCAKIVDTWIKSPKLKINRAVFQQILLIEFFSYPLPSRTDFC
jgi:hypothetical protein